MRKLLLLTLIVFITASTTAYAQDYRFGKVSKEELQQTQHPLFPEANAAILYREVRSKFEQTESEGFFLETEYFERIKIYNKEGFEYATKAINLYKSDGSEKEKLTDLKAYTYVLDGKKVDDIKLRNDGIFDQEVTEYLDQTKFTMPDVKEGSVIEFRYKIKTPFINNIDEYRFQEKIPIDKLSFRFASPEYFMFKNYQKGFLPFEVDVQAAERNMRYSYSAQQDVATSTSPRQGSASRTVTENITFRENSYNVERTSIPPLVDEPYSTNIDNYVSALKFELSSTQFPNAAVRYYSTTWEDVSKSIYLSTSFGGELEKTGYLSEVVPAIIEGAVSNQDKIGAIYAYVRKNTTWNNFNGIFANEGLRNTFKKGSGNAADINLLLVAMLREAGIQANPVLVSTVQNGIPIFPTRNGFNYVIAGIEMQNAVALLDATTKLGEPNILDPKLLNWQGRLIRNDGSSTWIPLVPGTPALDNSMVSFTINDDLSSEGTLKKRVTGHYALSYRENYLNLADDDTRKRLENNANQAELSNIAFTDLDTPFKPVQVSYDFENSDAAEQIGDKLYVSPMAFLATKENPFKSESRQMPIHYGYPQKDRYLITVNIPEGYEIETMPESSNFSMANDSGSYRYAISQSGNTIKLSTELSINQAAIGPVQYENLKQFYQLMVDKENEKIVLKKI